MIYFVLCIASDIVLDLASNISENQNFKLFYDNWFVHFNKLDERPKTKGGIICWNNAEQLTEKLRSKQPQGVSKTNRQSKADDANNFSMHLKSFYLLKLVAHHHTL